MPEAVKPSADAPAEAGSFESLRSEEVYPGVHRRTFSSHEATINSYRFDPGASFPLHSHPQEQITLVTAGTVEMTVEGQTTTLESDSWSVVAGRVEHGITAGSEGASIVALIVPRRQDPAEYELAEEGE